MQVKVVVQAGRPTFPSADDDQVWQDEQTRKGIEEADSGDFVTAEELKATINKFVPNA